MVSEEQEIHADHDSNQRDHIKHDGSPSSHQSKLSAPDQGRTRQSDCVRRATELNPSDLPRRQCRFGFSSRRTVDDDLADDLERVSPERSHVVVARPLFVID
jgi:hypothetical protein